MNYLQLSNVHDFSRFSHHELVFPLNSVLFPSVFIAILQSSRLLLLNSNYKKWVVSPITTCTKTSWYTHATKRLWCFDKDSVAWPRLNKHARLARPYRAIQILNVHNFGHTAWHLYITHAPSPGFSKIMDMRVQWDTAADSILYTHASTNRCHCTEKIFELGQRRVGLFHHIQELGNLIQWRDEIRLKRYMEYWHRSHN